MSQPNKFSCTYHKHYKKSGVFSRISLGKPPLGPESNYRVEHDSKLQLTWLNELYFNCAVVNAVFSMHRLEGTKILNVQTQNVHFHVNGTSMEPVIL